MVPIKKRLLIFLVLSRYRLACKYKYIIISQIKYQFIIGCRIAFSGISGIMSSYFQDQITAHRLSQLVVTSRMVSHMMS